MQHISTTPFGRRAVSAGLLASQALAKGSTPALPTLDKYSVLDDLRTARVCFGLNDRDLAVLSALLSFFPERQLSDNANLMVYPSNRALSERAHGMAESTLRRHLAALVQAGMILRHDSPNGKRYAARNASGELVRCFGFDLRPLLSRGSEIADQALQTQNARLHNKRLREDLVLQLRDLCKLIDYGLEAQPKQDWAGLQAHSTELRKSLRRVLSTDVLEQMISQVSALLKQVHGLLGSKETKEMSGSDVQNERHYQNSNKDSSDFESCVEARASGKAEDSKNQKDEAEKSGQQHPNIPLALVLKACPDILPYARDEIRHWHQLVATASHVRGMMGISPHAWAEAQNIMGPEVAAVTCAAILQRVHDIRNPGGYLRALTIHAQNQGFSPGPMIMALLNGAMAA